MRSLIIIPITDQHVRTICLEGQGDKQCRFLAKDDEIDTAHYCLKGSPDEQIIDALANKFVTRITNNKTKISEYEVPVGDNCGGYKEMLET